MKLPLRQIQQIILIAPEAHELRRLSFGAPGRLFKEIEGIATRKAVVRDAELELLSRIQADSANALTIWREDAIVMVGTGKLFGVESAVS